MTAAAAPSVRRGFTLLEMVVVLSIMGLATAMVAPSVFRSIGTWQRQGEVEAMLDQIRGLPAVARAQGRTIVISKQTLSSATPPLHADPGSSLTVPESWSVHHNGVCDGGRVRIDSGGRQVRIDVAAPFCDPQVVTR